jgi:hypothetical protein
MEICGCSLESARGHYKGVGGLLVCARCEGMIACDFCSDEIGEQISPYQLACHVVGGNYVCNHHVWIGVAMQEERDIR